jgi:hypothetical protein
MLYQLEGFSLHLRLEPIIVIVTGFWGLFGLIFIITYIVIKDRTSGNERFNKCYAILTIETIAGLILAFVSANIQPATDAPPPPGFSQPSPIPYFSLSRFLNSLFFMILLSSFLWVDLISQWVELRRVDSR